VIERRSFLKGFAALLVAPAIVRVENIMPVRALSPDLLFVDPEGELAWGITINRRSSYCWRGLPDNEFFSYDHHRLFEIEFGDPHPPPGPCNEAITGRVVRQADGTLGLTRHVGGTFIRPDGTLYYKRNGVISELVLPPPSDEGPC
jgi:hypothetical protein